MRIPRNAHDPIPTGLSRNAIVKLAEQATETWSFQPGTPFADLWKMLGGKVGRAITEMGMMGEFPTHESNCLIVYNPDDYVAMVPFSGSPTNTRYNLDMGVVIGHFVLHPKMVRDAKGHDAAMVVRYYPESDAEKQAQTEAIWFATSLAAPKRLLVPAWEKANGNRTALREQFLLPYDLLEGLYRLYTKSPALQRAA